jgi:ABC-type branched-subunit amino acid transport system ATPase component
MSSSTASRCATTCASGCKLPGARRDRRQDPGNQPRGWLPDVGLDYLSLDRAADTLSGGESQRIRLASQIGTGLTGVLYVLDEPSIGLHQRDNDRLLETLVHLRDLGNTVIVVEHDEDAIRRADYLVDIGPGAGVHGGCVVAEGTPAEVPRIPHRHRAVPVRHPAHRGPGASAWRRTRTSGSPSEVRGATT